MFYWIIGSDNLATLQTWKNWDALKKEVSFLVFPRPGYPAHIKHNFLTVLSEGRVQTSTISSTDIRRRIAKGLSIAGLVPAAVSAYIEKHKLYIND